MKNIQSTLKNKFECKRPTTPKNENIFVDFSYTRKNDFMNALNNLVIDLEKAKDEKNYKNATEYIINHFGDRFPLGKDEDEKNTNDKLSALLSTSAIKPKPYAKW